MAMNQIQFQSGLSLPAFLDQYGTQAKCARALYRARWPKGFRCPACDDRRRSSFRRGNQTIYQCRACQHQTTLIAGTLMQDTKLPLVTWFLAIYLLTSTKTNLAALELKRHLGVCYRTAWRLKHKIMRAMGEREQSRQLNGFVQIDDAYLGGERNGGKHGRGSENKQPFLIAVDTVNAGPSQPVAACTNAASECG
jgi:ribosomal protein L37AE/L43A